MLAAGRLPQVSPGTDDQRDDYDEEKDRVNVYPVTINRREQCKRAFHMQPHSRPFKKKSGLAKNRDAKGQEKPTPRTAQNPLPPFLPPPDGKAKKI